MAIKVVETASGAMAKPVPTNGEKVEAYSLFSWYQLVGNADAIGIDEQFMRTNEEGAGETGNLSDGAQIPSWAIRTVELSRGRGRCPFCQRVALH